MKKVFFLLFVALSFTACGNKSQVVEGMDLADTCEVAEGVDTISFDDEQEYARFVPKMKSAQNNEDENEDEEYEEYYYDENEEHRPQDLTVRTPSGGYAHYHSDGYGNTSGYDSNGNYYHSYSDGYGNTSGYDSNGNYYHGYSDGYGNTTIYDSQGNYYHGYSDGYGNTTIYGD